MTIETKSLPTTKPGKIAGAVTIALFTMSTGAAAQSFGGMMIPDMQFPPIGAFQERTAQTCNPAPCPRAESTTRAGTALAFTAQPGKPAKKN